MFQAQSIYLLLSLITCFLVQNLVYQNDFVFSGLNLEFILTFLDEYRNLLVIFG